MMVVSKSKIPTVGLMMIPIKPEYRPINIPMNPRYLISVRGRLIRPYNDYNNMEKKLVNPIMSPSLKFLMVRFILFYLS